MGTQETIVMVIGIAAAAVIAARIFRLFRRKGKGCSCCSHCGEENGKAGCCCGRPGRKKP
ncbi:MAG: hypothetical protein IAC87_06430 [Muribaculum sp.]|uniref:FeoB-associated Cys-rich membrane protein n=1 Tax=Candidatus Merdivivens faecigallinarum TaxID=2840871 RepID=A0A9D9NQ98_9BACT|nr:hypothetical protein [Candidatus Merdivivens faecigallinarum]